MTPEADIAAAITGHLGPDAPVDLDGVIVIGIASRRGGHSAIQIERVIRHRLTTEMPAGDAQESLRELRQRDAATVCPASPSRMARQSHLKRFGRSIRMIPPAGVTPCIAIDGTVLSIVRAISIGREIRGI